ncbi:MAG: ATP-dependent Clp protease ATP-binding subunit [bacterium]
MRIRWNPAAIRYAARERLWHDPRLFAAETTTEPVRHSDLPSQYLKDLARKIDLEERVLYRDPIIGRIITLLEKRKENSPVLIGEAGVGKTAIAEELARRIWAGNLEVKDSVGRVRFDRNTRIIELDLGGLQSLRANPPALDAEIKAITDFIEQEEREGNKIVLWIDEIHLLPGEFSRLDQYLKAPTGRGTLQIIGATTEAEYRQTFERDPALARRFPSIMVTALTIPETTQLLRSIYTYYEQVHNVRLQDSRLIEEVVQLAERYLRDRVLPGSAITLLDHALAAVAKRQELLANELTGAKKILGALLEDYRRGQGSPELEQEIDVQVARVLRLHDALGEEVAQTQKIVTKQDLLGTLSEISRRDLDSLHDGNGREALAALPDQLKAGVIGQDPAIDAICRHIVRAKTGLKEPKKPVCSVLLLGPTGVGKTEIARQLASLLFGSETAMLRYDMSEFRERHTVSRLLGSPPGYVGSSEGGDLVNKVRKSPEQLILFDEIEKAHPDVHMTLLGILDDGVATSRTGARAHFDRSIIIMTSNARQEDLGRFHFPPEFLNRLDEIITCNSLSADELRPIARLRLQELTERMADQGFVLEWTETAEKLLAEQGYNEAFGARPLKRVISRQIETALSQEILAHDPKELADHEKLKFTLSTADGQFTIETTKVEIPEPLKPTLNPQTTTLLTAVQLTTDRIIVEEVDELLGTSQLPAEFAVEIVGPEMFTMSNLNPWTVDPALPEIKQALAVYAAKFGVAETTLTTAQTWLDTCVSHGVRDNLDSLLKRNYGHSLGAFLGNRPGTNGGPEKLRTIIEEAAGRQVQVQFGQENDETLVIFVSNQSRLGARDKLAMDTMLEAEFNGETAAMEFYQASLARGIELDPDLVLVMAQIRSLGLRMFCQRTEGQTGYILKIPAPRVRQEGNRVSIFDNNAENPTGLVEAQAALNSFLPPFRRHPERRELVFDWLAAMVQTAKKINALQSPEDLRNRGVRISWEISEDGKLRVAVEWPGERPLALNYLLRAPESPEALVSIWERDEENISLTDLILLRSLAENKFRFAVHNNGDTSTSFVLTCSLGQKGDPEKLAAALANINIDVPQEDRALLYQILCGRQTPPEAEQLILATLDQVQSTLRRMGNDPRYHDREIDSLLRALLEIAVPQGQIEPVANWIRGFSPGSNSVKQQIITRLEERET